MAEITAMVESRTDESAQLCMPDGGLREILRSDIEMSRADFRTTFEKGKQYVFEDERQVENWSRPINIHATGVKVLSGSGVPSPARLEKKVEHVSVPTPLPKVEAPAPSKPTNPLNAPMKSEDDPFPLSPKS